MTAVTGPTVVTGAAGFAGRHLVSLLAAEGPVEGWYRPGVPPVSPDQHAIAWKAVDLRDRSAVAAAVTASQPSGVYHLAGAANQGASWADTDTAFELNALVTHELLHAVQSHAPHARVLVTSSAAVYAPSDTPMDESAPIGPTSPYGVSKLAQEMVALRAATEQDLDVVVVRPFNHIGPGQEPSYFAPAFARQLARIEAGLDAPTLLVGNLEPRRDLSDVRDTVRAYRLLMAHGARGAVYNVCRGTAYAIGEVLDVLQALVDVPVEVVVDPSRLRPVDQPLLTGDRRKISDLTGWTPQIPIEQTLLDILEDQRSALGYTRRNVPLR